MKFYIISESVLTVNIYKLPYGLLVSKFKTSLILCFIPIKVLKIVVLKLMYCHHSWSNNCDGCTKSSIWIIFKNHNDIIQNQNDRKDNIIKIYNDRKDSMRVLFCYLKQKY